jgi:hypothetical protein
MRGPWMQLLHAGARTTESIAAESGCCATTDGAMGIALTSNTAIVRVA